MIQFSLAKKLDGPAGLIELDVSIQVQEGAILTVFGESGAGKTSILRMLAGLMRPDNGTIEVNGKWWFHAEGKINLIPQKRKLGFVFQESTLFPNMSVRENVAYPLDKSMDRSMVDDLIDQFELGELQHKKPLTLSGGQKQKVALARALVRRPDLLLLDEPLSALDGQTRSQLQDIILTVHKTSGLTIILVSHDVGEIFKLSKEVLILDKGKVMRQGSLEDVFSNRMMSGKFQFTGEILSIAPEEVVFVIRVLVGNTIVKVVVDPSEVTDLAVGDKVVVASKAFNPVIHKLA